MELLAIQRLGGSDPERLGYSFSLCIPYSMGSRKRSYELSFPTIGCETQKHEDVSAKTWCDREPRTKAPPVESQCESHKVLMFTDINP